MKNLASSASCVEIVSCNLHILCISTPLNFFLSIFLIPTHPLFSHQLTQLLQGAVTVDLRFHGQLIGRWQLDQVVEGMGEGRVAAIVSHAPSHDATATRTFAAT